MSRATSSRAAPSRSRWPSRPCSGAPRSPRRRASASSATSSASCRPRPTCARASRRSSRSASPATRVVDAALTGPRRRLLVRWGRPRGPTAARPGTEANAMSPAPRSRAARSLVLGFAAAALLLGARPVLAKDKPKPPPPKTGVFQLPCSAPCRYVQMAVPKDYDAAKFYPLLFVLHPSDAKPDAFVAAWWEVLEKKGWIIAAPAFDLWDNEERIPPVLDALGKVKATYTIDDHRVALAGHNAGANMAWRMAVRNPEAWSSILAFSGEITDQDRAQVKKLVGKSIYIFRGEKDTMSYTAPMLERDKKVLEAFKIEAKIEVRPDWAFDFPKPRLASLVDWLDGVWPPGSYREKAAAVEAAIQATDVPAAQQAHADLLVELKKSPYPAFHRRPTELGESIVALGRSMIAEAKAMVDADPLEAVARMEAALKAVKTLKPVDAEATAALAALRKDPKVVAAVRKKEAEAQAVTYMGRAEAAEAKGDLAKALEWYRKAAALGDTSKKAEADAKVAELEPKVGAK